MSYLEANMTIILAVTQYCIYYFFWPSVSIYHLYCYNMIQVNFLEPQFSTNACVWNWWSPPIKYSRSECWHWKINRKVFRQLILIFSCLESWLQFALKVTVTNAWEEICQMWSTTNKLRQYSSSLVKRTFRYIWEYHDV